MPTVLSTWNGSGTPSKQIGGIEFIINKYKQRFYFRKFLLEN